MNTYNLRELLKGCSLMKNEQGDIIVQSIKNMKLVCLTTADEYSINKFENPLNFLASNQSYGHLRINNRSNKDLIVPAQVAVITDQSAQNHGMVKGAVVLKLSSHDYRDAGCVQGSQTGHIRETGGNTQIRFIPFSAREFIFEKAGKTGSHDNIYSAITKMGELTGSNSGTYLDKYFAKYDKELVEFIAHFERPDKCIGTVVLIDDEIVAVDKFPSFEYCEQIWDALIRDCYGALVLAEQKRNKQGTKVFTQILKRTDVKKNESVTDYLKRVLVKTKQNLSDVVKSKLEDLLDVDIEYRKDETTGKYTSNILTHAGYTGQVISEDSYHHLVCLVKREAFNPTTIKHITEMRKKAKEQNKFTL